MKYHYVIINDDQDRVMEIRRIADAFPQLQFKGDAHNFNDGIDLVLEQKPQIVFLEITPNTSQSQLSLHFISELHRFLLKVPEIFVTSKNVNQAFEAIKYGVHDYILFPYQKTDIRKAILRLEKKNQIVQPIEPTEPIVVIEDEIMANKEKPLTFCLKSYGDYRYFQSDEVLYLKADNNSTDIFLENGETLTAFKTLKHFEQILPKNFHRIHNSYIVNMEKISRIQMGNAFIYVKNEKIPFSKSYKEAIENIIDLIAKHNYREL
ncbi:DNA-binding response regulator [Flavobacterium sp. NST-5]|uniref:DNA-binding response regulator n=1 Tax=Flavobacterium ichthyis TaxID=2698827 RepID=A0ABW9Z7U6_9FLAO|nr:LytTR family DNA-binding domain-containing protein [Flavobacterium ichthyis]NBL64938.1 DNA-binding response regulator [Flavobacterium ichthyis]